MNFTLRNHHVHYQAEVFPKELAFTIGPSSELSIRMTMTYFQLSTGLITVIAAIVIPLLILLILRRASKAKRNGYGNSIIICGPSGSGKTALFLKLIKQTSLPDTTLSASVNYGQLSETGEKLIDIPGSMKLRTPLFNDALSDARNVILLLDSSQPVLAADMSFIIHVLSSCISRRIPILMMTGKRDTADVTAKFMNQLDERLKKLLARYSSGGEEEHVDEDDDTRVLRKDLKVLLDATDNETNVTMAELIATHDLHTIDYSSTDANCIDHLLNWLHPK